MKKDFDKPIKKRKKKGLGKLLISVLIITTLLTSCNRYMYPKINHPPQYQNIDIDIEKEPLIVIYSDKIVDV